jgi:hypothetical protein
MRADPGSDIGACFSTHDAGQIVTTCASREPFRNVIVEFAFLL